jgi:hypothetical protein
MNRLIFPFFHQANAFGLFYPLNAMRRQQMKIQMKAIGPNIRLRYNPMKVAKSVIISLEQALPA